MKKIVSFLICAVCVFAVGINVLAKEVLHYDFANDETYDVVTNTLADGDKVNVLDGKLYLDGKYGLKLGDVSDCFTVSAMISVKSTGDTNTVFFKDMDASGNKWTGILSSKGKSAFWTHGDGFAWTRVATGNDDMSKTNHVAYVENGGLGTLYVNGEKVGSGAVAKGNGTLYLGVTRWSADSVEGVVNSVRLYDDALTQSEIMAEYESFIDFEKAIELPSEVVGDISLVDKIASKKVTWKSSDESVITSDGKVTRFESDKKVVLSAYIGDEKLKDFEVTVLKKPFIVNDEIILSYKFSENDGEIIHDVSGNGNHGASFNNLQITKDGAIFDGVDDYVKMPDGVLYGHDNVTIVMKMNPKKAQEHVFAYAFGNTSSTGYMFLNPSRPSTNLIRFAGTRADYRSEREVVSLPGVRKGEWATVIVSLSEDGEVRMYIDGDLVMDGELKMTVSSLGETKQNYIAKSLYDNDPYFGGMVSEFTIYNSVLSDEEIAMLYKKEVQYAPEEENLEYIESVSFENGIDVVLADTDRNDVRIGVLVLDENGNFIRAQIVTSSDEIDIPQDGNVCVFAFDEENNIPGDLYVKGTGEGFRYEYTPGKMVLVSDESRSDGVIIIAGFDIAGTLTGVGVKKTNLEKDKPEEVEASFDKAVSFKLLYWENMETMRPVE